MSHPINLETETGEVIRFASARDLIAYVLRKVEREEEGDDE